VMKTCLGRRSSDEELVERFELIEKPCTGVALLA